MSLTLETSPEAIAKGILLAASIIACICGLVMLLVQLGPLVFMFMADELKGRHANPRFHCTPRVCGEKFPPDSKYCIKCGRLRPLPDSPEVQEWHTRWQVRGKPKTTRRRET